MADTKFILYLKTVALGLAFFTIGLVLSIIGPTILELQCAVGVSYEDIVKILPARASGYALGSMTVGILYDRLNPLLTIAITSTTMGLLTILLPWADSLFSLLAVAFFCNLGGGMIDSTSNVFILYMWGQASQPYMQATHFCFGLGGLVAPLLASPFLSAGEAPIEGLAGNVTSAIENTCNPEALRIHIPYAMLGSACILSALFFLYLYCCHGNTEEHFSRHVKNDENGTADVKIDLMWKKVVVAITALFLFTLLGLEVGLGSFITSFAVMSDHHLTKQVGAYMTSLYWFTYTFFRLPAIPLIDKIGIHCSIVLELGITVIANMFLLPFGNSIVWCLWVGVALVGIGISTLWASLFILLESFFPVTSGIASFLTVSACLGEWVYPVIMGYAIEMNPQLLFFGLAGGIIGPTFLDLQCALDVSYEDIIKILPARSTGAAIGSFVGGGLIDPACSLYSLHMWGTETQPYLLAVHFSVGVGGLVAPLVTSIFLSDGEAQTEGLASNATSATGYQCQPEELRIHTPYAIMGGFCILASFLLYYLFCFHRHTREHPSRQVKAEENMAADIKHDVTWTKRTVVILAGMLLFVLVSFEVGMHSFISSFAVMSDHHLSPQVGAYMTSLYSFTYTSFRLISIPVINRIGVYRNNILQLGTLLVSSSILVLFGNSVQWCLWVGVALMGMGISTLYISVFVLLENYFIVTSAIASFLTICSYLGGWVYPIIMGYAIETDPQLFLWIFLICTIVSCILFAILSFLCISQLRTKKDETLAIVQRD
ncbi:Major facilitator superfamily domain-containing protein 4A [Halotydeus destructor]|nr:Major facilitator superfamily domain-containing protein 4A [Halotydeus destructor]